MVERKKIESNNKENLEPKGYIYKATNIENKKVYIGKAKADRKGRGDTPIEKRWNEEISDAHQLKRWNKNHPEEKKSMRYIENAINKYGEDSFILEEEDVAYSKSELNQKEKQYIKEYDSRDSEKGYNLREGGEGGDFNESTIEKISKGVSEKWEDPEYRKNVSQTTSKSITEKWKNPEYREKQANERSGRAQEPIWRGKMTEINRERGEDPNWVEKMTEINQERAKKPEYQENMSQILKEKWQEQEYSNTVSERVSNKWQDAEYVDRQLTARAEGGKKITDKEQFLKDIQEMKKKDINEKYGMDGKTTNRKIHKMLGHQGVRNFSQAREYLKDKNLNDVMKDIKKNELQKETRSNTGVRKKIENKKEFLRDIQTMKKKDINEKYNMDGRTTTKRIGEMLGHRGVYTYSQAREYLKNRDLNKVVKDINQHEKIERANKLERGTKIENKEEFMKDIQNLSKKEINRKYQMDGKTINNKIEKMLGHQGVKNYSQAREYLQDKEFKDVLKDIEKQESNDNDEKRIDAKNEREDESLVDNDKKDAVEKKIDPEKEIEGSEDREREEFNKKNEENQIVDKEFNDQFGKEEGNESNRQDDLEEGEKGNVGYVDESSNYKDCESITNIQKGEHDDIQGITEDSADKGKDYESINNMNDDKGNDYDSINDSGDEQNEDFSGINNNLDEQKDSDLEGIHKDFTSEGNKGTKREGMGREDDGFREQGYE